MDKIPLITELNEKTRKKDEFEIALERSGMSLPDEDEMEFDMDTDAEDVDSGGEEDYTSDTGLEDDEIQEIVDWCEEECSDLSDEELEDTLRDELEEVDIEPEQMDAAIDRVMSMLGRGSDEEDMDDEDLGDEEGFGDEEGIDDEDEFPPEENEEAAKPKRKLHRTSGPVTKKDFDRLYKTSKELQQRFPNYKPSEEEEEDRFLDLGDLEFDPETDFRPEEDPDAEFVIDPKKHFRDYVRGEENEY